MPTTGLRGWAALLLLGGLAGCSSTQILPTANTTETNPGYGTLLVRNGGWMARAGCRDGAAASLVVGVDGYFSGLVTENAVLVLRDVDPGPHLVRLTMKSPEPCWPEPRECRVIVPADGTATVFINSATDVVSPSTFHPVIVNPPF